MSNSQEEIQIMMQRVMDNLKDVDTQNLKRLLRNINNIFPLKIEDVNSQTIRNKLFTSVYKKQEGKNDDVVQNIDQLESMQQS